MKNKIVLSLFVATCLACILCTSCSGGGGGGGGSSSSSVNFGTWKLSKNELEYKHDDYNLRTIQEYNWSSKKFTQKTTVKIGSNEPYENEITIDMSPVIAAYEIYEKTYGWSYPYKLTLNKDGTVHSYSGNGLTYKVTWKTQGNNLQLIQTTTANGHSSKGVITIPYKMSDTELVLEFSKIKVDVSGDGASASVDYSKILEGYTQNWYYTRQ